MSVTIRFKDGSDETLPNGADFSVDDDGTLSIHDKAVDETGAYEIAMYAAGEWLRVKIDAPAGG